MRELVWEPDDFAAVWYAVGLDRFPRPLRYLSKYRTQDEFDAHRHRFLSGLDEDQQDLARS